MARFYPDQVRQLAPESEKRVRLALDRLDSNWWVFHSIAWQSTRGGREADGEADFVILSRNHGLMVLEVKGGGVDLIDGRWTSTDRNGVTHAIKDPFEQAKDSKYALLRFLGSASRMIGHVPICHAVAFPDITVDDRLSASAPREIIMDRRELFDVDASLKRIFGHWGKAATLASDQISALTSLLAPTVSIRVLLSDEIEESARRLMELTDNQKHALDGLRRNREAVVLGGAGTGKTVLAVHKATSLALGGAKVLLTCFNRPLGDYLNKLTADNPDVTAHNFHKLAHDWFTSGSKAPPCCDSGQWFDFPDLGKHVLEAAECAGIRFDAVVVDEGQDFTHDWIEALQLLTSDSQSPFFYVFADLHQHLWARDCGVPHDWFTFLLDVNCRNTLPIAERVAGIFGDEVSSMGAPGRKPEFHRVRDQGEAKNLTVRYVTKLLEDDGLRPSQIVVLAGRRVVSELHDRHAGDEPFVDIGGRGVVACTPDRFKGLEADAVLLLPEDDWLAETEWFTKRMYVAMSRARYLLAIVGSSKIRDAIGWS